MAGQSAADSLVGTDFRSSIVPFVTAFGRFDLFGKGEEEIDKV